MATYYIDASNKREALSKSGADSVTEVDSGGASKRWACFETAADRAVWDGNVSQAAAAMGRKGGKSTSEAKASAVRANGSLGGRPTLR